MDRQLAVINNRLHDTVTALGSRLPETVAVGPVIAGRLLGRTGRASRFPTAVQFASYTGAARVASGEHARHRLSRACGRQLNHALHLIALVQVRTRARSRARLTATGSSGRARAEPPAPPLRRSPPHRTRRS